MRRRGLPDITNEPKSEIIRLLVHLTFIAVVTIIGVFIFEQISVTYFHPLMFMNAHIFTIIMMGVLAPLAALIVILQFENLNQALLKENNERKAAEKELRDAKAQAELYIDLMCHDINNMNQVSMGYLELAIDKVTTEGNLGTESILLLKKPFESLKNIAKLIENVRKLQMEQVGQLKLKPMDVGEVLTDIKAQYSTVPGRDVTINYQMKKGCMVMANELITDLFSNIVGNAIKHSSGPLTIDIGLTKSNEDGHQYYKVMVADDGPGIPDNVKKELSDRLCLVNVRYTGRGFGLCLIKTLIDDFRGKYRIEDRVLDDYTKGTRFMVMLPAVK